MRYGMLDFGLGKTIPTMPLTLEETVQQGSELQKTYIEFFNPSALDLEMLSHNHLKEVIVLRDIDVADKTFAEAPRGKKGKARDLEYTSTCLLRESRQTLYDYNGLLNRSHIDIGTLDEPRYQRTTDDGKPRQSPSIRGDTASDVSFLEAASSATADTMVDGGSPAQKPIESTYALIGSQPSR